MLGFRVSFPASRNILAFTEALPWRFCEFASYLGLQIWGAGLWDARGGDIMVFLVSGSLHIFSEQGACWAVEVYMVFYPFNYKSSTFYTRVSKRFS